jgi:hypothetical protein
MAVQVRVSGNPRVLHPTGAGAFLHPNPTRAEPGMGAGFIFHPQVYLKPERNKKTETRKKSENPRKKPEKPPKATHLQNPTGTRTRPKTRQVRVSNSTRLHFFTGRVFGRPDPLPSLPLVQDGAEARARGVTIHHERREKSGNCKTGAVVSAAFNASNTAATASDQHNASRLRSCVNGAAMSS